MLKHQVVWAKLAVTNPQTGKETILSRGEMFPDWVDDFTRFTLTSAGGVKAVETPDPALTKSSPEPVRLQEHKPDGSAANASEGPAGDQPPAGNGSREVWAAYATGKGAPESETVPVEQGGLGRDELRAKYGS